MNVGEEPIEIKIEPEINDILPWVFIILVQIRSTLFWFLRTIFFSLTDTQIFSHHFHFAARRFEDFDIDQFVDYLQNNNDDIGNNHDSSSPCYPPLTNGLHHPVDVSINSRPSESPDDSKSFGDDSQKETFFYKCTVCHEVVESGKDLLQHVRTHTRMQNSQKQTRNSTSSRVCAIVSRSSVKFH